MNSDFYETTHVSFWQLFYSSNKHKYRLKQMLDIFIFYWSFVAHQIVSKRKQILNDH